MISYIWYIIWYVILYVILYDMSYYVILYVMLYVMLYYMLCYMICYIICYVIWYVILYDMIYCMIWYMIRDMWYMICDIWYVIYDVIYGIWHMMWYGIWCVIYDMWYICDMWYIWYNIMGPSYMRSVVDRIVVMRRMTVSSGLGPLAYVVFRQVRHAQSARVIVRIQYIPVQQQQQQQQQPDILFFHTAASHSKWQPSRTWRLWAGCDTRRVATPDVSRHVHISLQAVLTAHAHCYGHVYRFSANRTFGAVLRDLLVQFNTVPIGVLISP